MRTKRDMLKNLFLTRHEVADDYSWRRWHRFQIWFLIYDIKKEEGLKPSKWVPR